MSEIPAMTDPLGKHWDQPNRREILVDDLVAIMSPATMDKLGEYSSSVPSGVYDGKMWRANPSHHPIRGEDAWYLRWYGPSEHQDRCSINTRKILLVD